MVLGWLWTTSTKLARTLERGRWAGSERLRREFGERPRAWESSKSLAAALFSNSDRRFRTAEEDRGSGMALRERGSNQLESAPNDVCSRLIDVRTEGAVRWMEGEGREGREGANQCSGIHER
jgi:hypothetical protein